jgi:azurin
VILAPAAPEETLAMMMRFSALVCLILALSPLSGAAGSDPARLITLVATDDMKFNLTVLRAVRGELLRVRLDVRGQLPVTAMAHNFVLLRMETDVNKLINEGSLHRDKDFIPPSMAKFVIAKTRLAGANERVEVTFTAPRQPGSYPFLCTFAGHYQAGMKGTLIVR